MDKRIALYMRVSTDGQSVEMQRRELIDVAEHKGWRVIGEYVDEGVSGAKGRDQRPEFDRLCKDMVRGRFDVVGAWSVDRLGRSLLDLVSFLQEMHAAGCGLFLHKQGVDTSTAAGRALFQMLGVFAEFERAMIVDRTRSGLARARENGTRSGKAIGRPSASIETIARVRAALAAGGGINSTAKRLGVDNGLVARVRAEMRARA